MQQLNNGHGKPGDPDLVFLPGVAHPFRDVTDRAALTMMTTPVYCAIRADDQPERIVPTMQKPPYRVMTMAEIRAREWNGFTAASTFSGGGGSSTGYRMAGFKIGYASEFVDEARATYAANMAPHTVLDGRDIRTVTGADILKACGVKLGELDLFDGSPPCSAFSTAGKREQGWGTAKAYSTDKVQRVDDLFFEYARLIREMQPRTFVAENVSGLVKGTAKGYFLRILQALKDCGYQVEAQLLDAQWLGTPQARQRLIFVGVRQDLGLRPAFPKPLPYNYTVRDALPWIGGVNTRFGPRSADLASPTVLTRGNAQTRSELTALAPPGDRVIHDTSGLWSRGDITDRPSPTVTVRVNSVNSNHFQVEREASMDGYAVGAEWDRLKPGQQSDRYFQLVRSNPDKACQTVTAAGGNASTASVAHPYERRKFAIAELKRICGFPDDYVLTGSYAEQWERCGRAVPPTMMSHIAAAVRDQILTPLRKAGRI